MKTLVHVALGLTLSCFGSFDFSQGSLNLGALQAQNILDQALHHYDFNGRIRDRARNGHLGCPNNNCTGLTTQEDRNGQLSALSFEGGFMGLDPLPYNFQGLPTMAMWLFVPTNSPNEFQYLIDTRMPGQSNLPFLGIDVPTRSVHFGISPTIAEWDNAVPVGRWFHLVVTTSGFPTAYTLYIDGVEQTATTYPRSPNNSTGVSTSLSVGVSGSRNNVRRFRGRMDELIFFSGTLSQSQVTELYNLQPDYVLHHFEFDGELADRLAGRAWTGLDAGNPPGYIDDRNGNGSSALKLTNAGIRLDPPTFSGNRSHSISMWVKPDDNSPRNAYLFDMRQPGQAGKPVAVLQAGGTIQYSIGNGTKRYGNPLQVGVWSHLSFTMDETTNEFKIYHNGQELTNPLVNDPMTTRPSGATAFFTLGESGSRNFVGRFDGAYDDVIVHTKALSAAEVTDLAGVMVDTQAPTDPGMPSIDNVTATTVDFSWATSSDNVGVARYEFDVKPAGQSVNTAQMLNAGLNLNTNYTGLQPASDYVVYVRAVDAAGNASGLSFTSFTTANATDTEAPSQPVPGATTILSTAAEVSWQPSTDNVGVVDYLYDFAEDGMPFGPEQSTNGITIITLTGLTPNTLYSIRVTAVDAAGNRSNPGPYSFRTEQHIDTEAPTAPGSITIIGLTTTSVEFSWAASTDNVGVTNYQAENASPGVTPSGAFNIGTTRQTMFSGLTPDTDYELYVRAQDDAGNTSAWTTLAYRTPATPDIQAPILSNSIAIDTFSASGFTLSWAAATDNIGVVGYTIQSNELGRTDTVAFDASAMRQTLVYTGLDPNTRYTGQVKAYDAAGNVSAGWTYSVTTAGASSTRTLSEQGYTVYPNPVSKSLLTILGPEQVERVFFTDAMGRLVLSTTSLTDQVDISPLATGTYTLRAFAKTGKPLGVTRIMVTE